MTQVFDRYSEYYQLLYRDKDYQGETDYVCRLLSAHGAGCKSIIEIGSGTGVHGGLFANAGYEVTGIELSDTMLAKACESPAARSGKASFLKGDARSFRGGAPLTQFFLCFM